MNIGKVIKVTAIIFIFLFLILFAFLGGALLGTPEGVFIGILAGLAIGWLQFILLYGFGKMIDDVHQIRKKTCGDAEPAPKAAMSVKETPRLWNCPLCGRPNPVGQNTCFHCGTRLDDSASNVSTPIIDIKADGSWVCPFCDTHNAPESKFCQNCGIER